MKLQLTPAQQLRKHLATAKLYMLLAAKWNAKATARVRS